MRDRLLTTAGRAVYDALAAVGIEEGAMRATLANVVHDFARASSSTVAVDAAALAELQRLTWFNAERAERAGSLRTWGARFPRFMSICPERRRVAVDELSALAGELSRLTAVLPEAETVDVQGDLNDLGARVVVHNGTSRRTDRVSGPVVHCRVRGPLAAQPLLRARLEAVHRALSGACLDALRRGVDLQIELQGVTEHGVQEAGTDR